MKLYATLKNNRGGKKSTGDDTRILVELSYGNKILGELALYAIIDEKVSGYRILWNNEVIEEQEGEKKKDKHELIVGSYHDVLADCPCGWHYIFTGAMSHELIKEQYDKHI